MAGRGPGRTRQLRTPRRPLAASPFQSSAGPVQVLRMLAAVGSLAAALWGALHLRTVLLGAVAFLFFADFFKSRRPKNFPPGPWLLPFLGNFFYLDFEKSQLALQRVGGAGGPSEPALTSGPGACRERRGLDPPGTPLLVLFSFWLAGVARLPFLVLEYS